MIIVWSIEHDIIVVTSHGLHCLPITSFFCCNTHPTHCTHVSSLKSIGNKTQTWYHSAATEINLSKVKNNRILFAVVAVQFSRR